MLEYCSHRWTRPLVLGVVVALAACGADGAADGVDGGVEDADAASGPACQGSDPQFNDQSSGVAFVFTISNVELLGNPLGVATGYFQPAAREDFAAADSAGSIPIDTCRVGEQGRTPSCTSSGECAPEQQCLPENDSDGNPIPNSDRCTTARSPIDVGPFTVRGFATGERTFSSDAQQQGAYTSGGNGLLEAADIAYDVNYVIEGGGDAAQSLGAYRGSLFVPSLIDIVRPVPTSSMFGREITVDPAVDLELEWSGATAGGEVELTLAGAGQDGGGGGGSVTCRVTDDGAFTIPAEMVQAAKLGSFSFTNVLTISRRNFGSTCGEGLTVAELMSETTIVINMKVVE